jgi:hypothetical protein
MFQDTPIGFCHVFEKTVIQETLITSQYSKYTVRTDALPDAVVERTYADFLWLSQQMYADFPGYIMPALPETTSNIFDNRVQTLEQYLNRLSAHKLFRKSPKLETFLLGNDASLETAKEQSTTAIIVGAHWLNSTFSFLSSTSDHQVRPCAYNTHIHSSL